MSLVLQVRNLGKRYRFYATPRARLAALLGWAKPSKAHWALKDVSFDLQPGQCLGVVGDNGAGKSTLLKLLANTLHPSTGEVQRTGRLTAILELGAGFHPDFTGRENVMFGGSLIGLSPAQMADLFEGILAFSELGDAIDRPVKTYSSGMTVRLAFALVTAVQPEVLIVDEALAVGDQHFQKKCIARIALFRENGCTILFCSHSLYHVRQLCDRVLWLNRGEVKGLGHTEAVLSAYETHVRLQDAKPQTPDPELALGLSPEATPSPAPVPGTGSTTARLLSATLASGAAGRAQTGPDLVLHLSAQTPAHEVPSLGVMLEQYKGVGIASVATHAEGVTLAALHSADGVTTWACTLTFTELPLHSGQYSLSFYLFDHQGLVVCDEWKDHITFEWLSPSLTPGLVRLAHQWS